VVAGGGVWILLATGESAKKVRVVLRMDIEVVIEVVRV
jgi:hypothetical protein